MSFKEAVSNSNITLSTMKEGGVEEQFQTALLQVLRNIEDPNTDPKAKRTITVKIEITPTPDRGLLMVDAAVTSKLASNRPVATAFLLKQQEDGAPFAFEPIQENLEFPAQTRH